MAASTELTPYKKSC